MDFEGGAVERSTLRTSRAAVTGLISLPVFSCLPSLSVGSLPLSFAWAVSLTTRTMTDAEEAAFWSAAVRAQRGRELIIPRDTLIAGASYYLTLTATPVGDELQALISSGSSSYTLHVTPSELAVSISGGARRTIGADVPLALDAAAASYDPDEPSAALDSYSWSCSDANANAEAAGAAAVAGSTTYDEVPCSVALNTAGASAGLLSLAPSSFTPGSLLQFTVTAQRGARTSSATALVEVTAGSPPNVRLDDLLGRPGTAVVNGNLVLNPDVKLSVSGSAQPALGGACAALLPESLAAAGCAASFSWSLALAGDATSAAEPILSGVDVVTLIIPRQTVAGGTNYVLKLDVSSLGSTGSAQLTIRGALPPSGGQLDVTPSSGVQYEDTFGFVQSGWWDEPENLPLTYEFEYSTEQVTGASSVATWRPLAGPFTVPTHSERYLPSGNFSARGVAINALGVKGYAYSSVVVTPPALDESGLADLAQSQLGSIAEIVASGQPGGTQATSTILDTMNKAKATAASTAERRRRLALRQSPVSELNAPVEPALAGRLLQSEAGSGSTESGSGSGEAAPPVGPPAPALPPPAAPPLSAAEAEAVLRAQNTVVRNGLINLLASPDLLPNSATASSSKSQHAFAIVSALEKTDEVSEAVTDCKLTDHTRL